MHIYLLSNKKVKSLNTCYFFFLIINTRLTTYLKSIRFKIKVLEEKNRFIHILTSLIIIIVCFINYLFIIYYLCEYNFFKV